MAKPKTIYKGERYGKLVVVETTTNKDIICLCDCGREIIVSKGNLTFGKSKSCGKGICHSLFIDISGQRFGSLIVQTLAGSDTDHGTLWNCICDCSKECLVRGNSLRRGRTKSCGCMSGTFASAALSKEPGLSNVNQLYNTYKNQARRREYEWKLSLEEFREIIKENCYYCGIEPLQKIIVPNISGERVLLYNGIDRVNNTIGYTMDNIVPACGTCNIAKKKLSLEEFVKWIERVYKNLSERKIV